MTQTTRRDPVRAVGELLLKGDSWTIEAPTVERYEDTDMDTKMQRRGAYIYVFQPTSTEKRAFSADYTETDDRDVVHLQIWATEKPPSIKSWLEVEEGDTHTIGEGDTEQYTFVEASGTLQVSGTLEVSDDIDAVNDTETLRRDVEGILNQYANDNQQDTPFTTIRPIDGQDYRAEQTQSSGTEQVEEVYVELRGLQDA